jgi:uncharacterized protein (DUF58 family)
MQNNFIDDRKKLFDPLTLAKIGNLFLRAKIVVEGFISGLHQSPFKGWSLEFAQHREYTSGDELKYLDWRIYGRTDRYFVKQYEEETNLKSYLVLDCSNSMGYKSGSLSKFDYGCSLAACLAYLMLKQSDAVGLTLFNNKIETYLPARSNWAHLSLILNKLETVYPSGETKIFSSLSDLGKYIRRRGLIILISDLFEESAEVVKILKYFRYKKNEVIVFHLLDPSEKKLPEGDAYLFENLENKEKISAEPGLIREEYIQLMDNFIENYKLNFRRSDIDYSLFTTDTSLDYALGSYLAKRAKL